MAGWVGDLGPLTACCEGRKTPTAGCYARVDELAAGRVMGPPRRRPTVDPSFEGFELLTEVSSERNSLLIAEAAHPVDGARGGRRDDLGCSLSESRTALHQVRISGRLGRANQTIECLPFEPRQGCISSLAGRRVQVHQSRVREVDGHLQRFNRIDLIQLTY